MYRAITAKRNFSWGAGRLRHWLLLLFLLVHLNPLLDRTTRLLLDAVAFPRIRGGPLPARLYKPPTRTELAVRDVAVAVPKETALEKSLGTQ